MNYQDFLKTKMTAHEALGFNVGLSDLNPMLFDWQKVIVRWAIHKGRCALFEACGLGKTPQQLEWARHICKKTERDVLILAPLAVSSQTVREGKKFGIKVNMCKSQKDVKKGINITNYEKLEKFGPKHFIGIVLDESSILKSFTGKIRTKIIESFLMTPYKLACTATPSPNDYMELGNHSEFLGVMTRTEMLSMYFINDTGRTGTWRLKGHVKKNIFWEWMSSWAVMIEKPSDIGFDDDGFILPELKIQEKIVKTNSKPKKGLFVLPAKTLTERREARKESLDDRIKIASDIVNNKKETCIAWCNLNIEGEKLSKQIEDSIEIRGSNTEEYKEKSMLDFSDDKIKCLISKPKISGFGMNWQNCSNVLFVGLSDSYEQFYQAVRRCWRYGQKNPVNVYIIIGEREITVLENIKRKESDMVNMYNEMVLYMKSSMLAELKKLKMKNEEYHPQQNMNLPNFLIGN